MTLFYAAVKIKSVFFLLKFPFCCYDQVFSYAIALVYHLKLEGSGFSSHFRSLVFVVFLSGLMLLMLLLAS